MKKQTFKRGIHIRDEKSATKSRAIRELAAPQLLYFALSQHIGAPLSPLVKPGERVLMGQRIADSEAPLSAPLHASVSGVVKEIGTYLHANGTKMPMVVVENDGLYEKAEPLHAYTYEAITPSQIIDVVHRAGIVGMGGAGFPTHVKLSTPKPIHHVIINGAECEPYLTSDHRLMLEQPALIITGLLTVLRLFPEAKGYVAVEDNKPDAIAALKKAAAKHSALSVITLAKKYPQGSEKQLIYAVTGREVPAGHLPMDAGCLVLNTDTAASICRAVTEGLPLYRRIVTVAGDAVRELGNFAVPIGTPFSYLLQAAGGLVKEPEKIIMGGPMMGLAVRSPEVPVVKGTSAVLAFSQD
ncbi:MAG: electron transport complex subunit RsxC, partial [Clostridia bacterium]|nr:electron transport complex subunit RsxC [Clostridia bacterium]